MNTSNDTNRDPVESNMSDPDTEYAMYDQDAWSSFFQAQEALEQKVMDDLGVSATCAQNILYLRTRSRWTQALEDELVRMDKAGHPSPNMMDWP